MTTTQRPPHGKLRRVLPITATAVLLSCCGSVAFFVFGGEWLAKALIPKAYSNMVGECTRSGGPDTMWEICGYRSPDDVDRVLAYYEHIMPGFSELQVSGRSGICHYNGRSDASILGKLAAIITDGTSYPGVSVMICDSDVPGAKTDIQVRTDWPAQ